MAYQGSWELSFLIDRDARIVEGRGACKEHLGVSLQGVIGSSLMSYVMSEERRHLRRFLGQVNGPSAKRAAVVRLQSATGSVLPYSMEVQQGRSASDNWIMFSRGNAGPGILEERDLPVVMADDGQFLRLVEMAAASAYDSLDLTTIEIGGLSNPARLGDVGSSQIAAFERSVGEALSNSAHEGILTNPSPGQYNLLHDPQHSAATIASGLEAVALQHGISREQAGIVHATMSVAPKASMSAISSAVRHLQEHLPGRGKQQPAGEVAGGGNRLAVILGISAFVAGLAIVALWVKG